MNKLKLSLLCLLAMPIFLRAQSLTWHQRYKAPGSYNATYCHLTPEGDHFLLTSERAIFQINQLGELTNYLDFASPQLTAHSAIKKYAPGTAHPYFVVTRRTGAASKDYALAEYRPGLGLVNETAFSDSLGISPFARPVLLETTDNSYLVFGRRFYRKVNYNPATGFTEEWARPLTIAPIAVLPYNNSLILADEKGNFQALDADGNELWKYTYPLQFRAMKLSSDGFLACGKISGNQAAILKLNFDGTEAWTKSYPENVFNDIILSADGGFAVAGLTAMFNMTLVKLDAAGDVAWRQEYPGASTSNDGGAALLELPDGGFLFLGKGKLGIHCLRTDPLGNAPEPELTPVNSRYLRNSALQTEIQPNAMLFFDGNETNFIALEDSSAATVFAFDPWIAGKDAAGNLHLAADTYTPAGRTDYRAGAVGIPAADFNRVWAASRAEIRQLREDFRLDQNLDKPAPFDLLSWPGKGNPNLQYNLDFSPLETDPELFPAPFVDVNGDGRYNVYDGDYPAIKGDQMAWWLFTDETNHTLSNGTPLLVDFQAAAYTYDCVQNPTVEKSLFLDYTVINRSGNNYQDTYLGFFSDPDLGCHLDDYIGTAPQANAWYVYNQDDLDASCQGVTGFGAHIPVQSIHFLNRSLDHTMYFANPSVGVPSPPTTDPDLPAEYYQFLLGRWRDGTPLTRGGNGYNPMSTDTVNHVFLDSPSDPQGWSMCTANLPYGDFRMVGSHGPFDLAASDTFLMQLAFTRQSDVPLPCPDIFGIVTPPLQQLQQWNADGALDLFSAHLAPVYSIASGQVLPLDASSSPGAMYTWSTGSNAAAIEVTAPGNYTVTISGQTGCTQVQEILVQTGVGTVDLSNRPQWQAWPNPSTGRVFINCPDCVSEPLQAVLYNAQGQLLRQQAAWSAPGSLNLQDLPEGLYWLELRGAQGSLGVRRLALQR